MTYEIEVLECKKNYKDLLFANKMKWLKRKGQITHSALPVWEGSSTHDLNGDLKRTGGGPSKDYMGEVEDVVGNAKKNLVKLESDL